MLSAMLEVLKRLGVRGVLLSSSLLLCLPLAAQEGLSTLRGTVTDPSGAVVPGVTVVLEEVSTNIKVRSLITDNQGNYEIPGLKQGAYRLTAAVPGFKTFVANDIVLESNQVRRIDVPLQVGATESEVTVTASTALVETEQGKIGAEFTGSRYRDIPIPGNAFGATTTVLVLLPAVQGRVGGGTPAFAGQARPQVDMGMDGVKEETLNSQTVNMEFVEEMKLVAVNNTAEYSRVGYFDAVSKRGSNQYHGEASYYHRNSTLGARSTFEGQKTRDLYHTFNLSGSGPVIKNKTFFYGLWNGERVPGKSFRTRNVPTEKMRKGDFSQLLSLARPVNVLDPLSGQPFSGNIIPASRLSAVSQKVQENYFPLPNRGDPNTLVNNFGWVHPFPGDQFHADVLVTRIDHNISSRNSIFGRFSAYLPRYVLAGNYPALVRTKLRQSHSWTIVDTHLFSPHVLNTFTFGGNRDGVIDNPEVAGYEPPSGAKLVTDVGLKGVNPRGIVTPGGFPVMDITGFSTLTVRPGGVQVDKNFTYADSMSWSIGRHVLKFGGELRTYHFFDGEAPEGTYGSFSFNGTLTNNAYADFLLGLPFTSQRLDPFVNRAQRTKELGLFITDTFKVSNRLTVDYGLRWDYFTATTFEDGLQFNWDRATGNVIVPDSARSSISPLYPTNTINVVAGDAVPHPEKTNFGPRVAAAYRVTNNTVIRGGYGIFNEFFGKFVRAQGGGPFQISETFTNGIQNGQPLFQFPNPFPTGAAGRVPVQSVSGYPTDTKNGYIHQFNVTAEREIHNIGFRLSYIGSRDRGLNYNLAINKPRPSLVPFSQDRRPYAQFVGASFIQTDGRTNYDSMMFGAKRTLGWVTFDAHWTWAHNMSDFLNLENPYDHRFWNRDFTAKHRAVIQTLWDLPVGRGKRIAGNVPGSVNQIIGGWKVVWVSFFQTGQYFSPSFSGFDASNTQTTSGLPDRIANGNLPTGQRTLDRWFDVAAFVRPPAGRFGNSGANILQGPGLNTQNVSISKRFPLRERFHLDFMTMISNLFNHPNFLNPGSNISAPAQAGVVTTQHGFFSDEKSGPRMIEMRLRLEF